MINSNYALGAIVAMAGVTFALRALPFLAARWLKKHDKVTWLHWLELYLYCCCCTPWWAAPGKTRRGRGLKSQP